MYKKLQAKSPERLDLGDADTVRSLPVQGKEEHLVHLSNQSQSQLVKTAKEVLASLLLSRISTVNFHKFIVACTQIFLKYFTRDH